MGRKTKYQPEYADIVRTACEEFGATNEQLARLLNVSTSTLHAWRTEHAELASALKDGKESYDEANVDASILAQALGFYMKVELYNAELDKCVTMLKYFPPDLKAAMVWKANRCDWHWPGRGLDARSAAARQLPGDGGPDGAADDDVEFPGWQ